MPVNYSIDLDRRLIRTQCFGNLTLPEVIDHFQTLGKDPICPNHLDVLLDVSEVSSLPASAQLQMVVSEIKQIRHKVKFGFCAVIAERDALYGMLRVFEVIAQDYFLAITVCRTRNEAVEWLERRIRPRSIKTA